MTRAHKTLRLEDVKHLPRLTFKETRIIKPAEIAQFAPVRGDKRIVEFLPPVFVNGVYEDNKTGRNYLIYSEDEMPFGGFPSSLSFDNIFAYRKVKIYSKQ